MGFSRQEYWSGLPYSPPGDPPNPGIEPTSLESPALAGGFFTTSTTWEANFHSSPTAYILSFIKQHLECTPSQPYTASSSFPLRITSRSIFFLQTVALTISRSLLKFMSIESVMLSNYLILCHLLLLPSGLLSIRVIFQFSSVQSLSRV